MTDSRKALSVYVTQPSISPLKEFVEPIHLDSAGQAEH